MFLRRDKPAGAISRPTKAQTAQKQQTKKTVKPLGGWEADEEQQQQNNKPTETLTKKVPTTNIFGDEQYVEVKYEEKQAPTSTLYSYSELSEMSNLQHQIRLVDEILQPGGIKIKPNEGMLSQFAQAAKTLDKDLIGSLLISRLEQGFPYAVKAKALYTIEYLAKKNQTYREYFQQFLEQIRNQPQPSENASAYNNLLKDVLNFIQNGSQTPATSNISSTLITFEGPDYNEDLPYAKDQGVKILNIKKEEQKNQKKLEKKGDKVITKTFISPGEAKKIKKSNQQAEEATLIETSASTAKPTPNSATTSTSNGSFNIFDLDLSTGAEITKQQPKPTQPIQVPQVPSSYQNTMVNPNMTPQQFQQYQQYQQYMLQQQQLAQQQFLQKQQANQGKPITGEELYSLYKK